MVSFDDKKGKDDKRQKWKKSETDENGFFNLTNPHYGKLLTAKERNKWTLEGKLVLLEIEYLNSIIEIPIFFQKGILFHYVVQKVFTQNRWAEI